MSNTTNTAKRPSRLQRLVSSDLPEPSKVVGAGEAIDHDLSGSRPASAPETPVVTEVSPRRGRPVRAVVPTQTKRTFRLPRSLDVQLKKFVRRYNAGIDGSESEVTLEELGGIMIQHFLNSNPAEITDKARGRR